MNSVASTFFSMSDALNVRNLQTSVIKNMQITNKWAKYHSFSDDEKMKFLQKHSLQIHEIYMQPGTNNERIASSIAFEKSYIWRHC